MNPIRLFVVVAIIHFLTIGFQLDDLMIDANKQTSQFQARRHHISVVDSLHSFIDQMKASESSDQAIVALDSIQNRMNAEFSSGVDTLDLSFLTQIMKFPKDIAIATADYNDLSEAELYEKYQIETRWQKLSVTQSLKMMTQEPGAFVNMLYGNLVWVLLLTIPLIALLMKILYIRKSHYWVEHLIFLVHTHCLLFLITTIAFILYYITASPTVLFVGLGLNVLLFWIALKLYYGQGFFKTTMKWSAIGVSYLFVLPIFFVLNTALCFLLY